MNEQNLNNQGNQTNEKINGFGQMSGQALGQVPDTQSNLVNSAVPPVQPVPEANLGVPPVQPNSQVASPPDASGSNVPPVPSDIGVQGQVPQPTLEQIQQPVPEVSPVNQSESTIVNPAGEIVNMNGPVTDSMPSSGMIPPTGIDPTGVANSNGFVETTKTENIGTIPPAPENNNEKKPTNKVVFIILIVALIAGIAYGVYYYLSLSKSKVTVQTKDLTISLGGALSSDPRDYATITGTSPNNCVVDILSVDNHKAGDYEYTLTCNNNSYKGKVTITDTEAPTATMKIVYKKVNSTITAEEFAEKCEDPSNCTMTFADDATVKGYLATVGGPNNVDVVISDSVGNTKTETGILYVLPENTSVFLCSGEAETLDGVESSPVVKNVTDRIIFEQDAETGSYKYLDLGRREYNYKFGDVNAFSNAIGPEENNQSYDGISGFTTYDKTNFILNISTPLDMNVLNTEAGGSFATDLPGVINFYSTKGYTCVVDQSLLTN